MRDRVKVRVRVGIGVRVMVMVRVRFVELASFTVQQRIRQSSISTELVLH